MVYNNVLLKVKDVENIQLVRDLLKEQARRSSEEPGCILFSKSIIQNLTRSNSFWLSSGLVKRI